MKPSGFSLLEVLMTMAIGAILLTLLTTANFALRSASTIQNQNMEIERNMIFISNYLRSNLAQAQTLSGINASPNDSLTYAYAGMRGCVYANIDVEQLIMNGMQLRCDGYGVNSDPKPQPLLDNVASIQFLYGIDSNSDGSINSYASANNITDWQQVKSVLVGLLLRSAKAVYPDNQARSFKVLDIDININDRYLYRQHQFVVALRNRFGVIKRN